MRVDDDCLARVDRADCGMINPQAMLLLKLKTRPATANGLNDRISVPEKRTTFAHAPVKVVPRK